MLIGHRHLAWNHVWQTTWNNLITYLLGKWCFRLDLSGTSSNSGSIKFMWLLHSVNTDQPMLRCVRLFQVCQVYVLVSNNRISGPVETSVTSNLLAKRAIDFKNNFIHFKLTKMLMSKMSSEKRTHPNVSKSVVWQFVHQAVQHCLRRLFVYSVFSFSSEIIGLLHS